MTAKYFILACLIFSLPYYFTYGQTPDSSSTDGYKSAPSIAGGQFEITTLLYVFEVGVLMDFDLVKNTEEIEGSFGLRTAFEHYGYLEPGGPTDGGPFNDYSLYLRYSSRSASFHLNLLAGIAYHTRKNNLHNPNQNLPRLGFEMRFNLLEKMFGLLIKGSTSFEKRNFFLGVGIGCGYYR